MGLLHACKPAGGVSGIGASSARLALARSLPTRQVQLGAVSLGRSADDALEVLPAAPPANAFPYRGSFSVPRAPACFVRRVSFIHGDHQITRDSTMKPLPPHVVRALQEQQQ